ncbi:MAG: hypothetical protein H7201_07070 [Candidatus Saccharibacteria bacterium]|nr:hypothetical protein [Microbacteriaceae bacterium]
MVSTTGIDVPAIKTGRRPRLNRQVLAGNLASGAALLLLAFVFVPSPLLLLTGAVYIAGASSFLASVYARHTLTGRQEALAWVAPWLAAVAL